MNRAFLAIGLAFLVVGIASSTVAGGIVWSTFVTLGVVFLALAFAFRGDDEDRGQRAPEETTGGLVDEDG